MNHNKTGFTTTILTTSPKKPDAHGAIHDAIYKSAAFEFPSSTAIAKAFQNQETTPSHTYSRITNPTVDALERKITAVTGAQNVMMLSSGMAAISNTFMALAYAGSNIVTSPHLFGNTFAFFQFSLAAFGVEVRFVDTDDLDAIRAAIDDHTCAFFCEVMTNPHMEIANLPEISKLLTAHHIPLIVDSTVIPWCSFDAKKFGVDIELVSTTKYVSGGATSIGGAIVDYGTFDWSHNQRLQHVNTQGTNFSPFMFKIKREIARNFGACMDPDTAYLQSLGLETLSVRYAKMSESAYALAQFLESLPAVTKVSYPKLPSHPYHAISEQLFTGLPGAMVTLNLPSKEHCYAFMDRLQIIKRATNLFDNHSLIIHPESTIYGTFTQEMKDIMGIDPTLLRLSVGLEDIDDLKQDIIAALQ